jgi:hypothetical protein
MAVHGRYLVPYRNLPDENTVRVERVLHSSDRPGPARHEPAPCPSADRSVKI